MRKRPLGKTGLVVSELAIGTWGLSGDAYGKVEEADAEAVLRRAIDIGFSLVETADAYGVGRMERLCGRLAKDHPELVLVTKGGIDRTTDPPRKCFALDYLRGAVERSLKRIGRDALQVYLLHSPTPETLHSGEAVDAMQTLVKEGKIEHWGVAAGDEDVARAAIDKGAEVVSLAYNLTHPIDLHRISGDAMVGGCGILARSVLGHGLLAGMWAKDRSFDEGDHRSERWTKMELELRIDQLDAVRFLVKGDVHTLRGAAVRFALANHLVSAAVLGPRTKEQLEQLVRETGGGPRYLPDDDLRQLPRALDKVGIQS
ncbi:MAG: aldo/keto reductase [Labilithrix sp.]|nr:aldo/keto reductase [Labilithrix sp.]MBX3220931.1 aldo/keto reductase [Labilithrix sp.]